MRLDITLVHHHGVELALDDDIGLFEALCDIALLELQAARYIAGLAGIRAPGEPIDHLPPGERLVEQRAIVLHRLMYREEGFEELVVHLDEAQGLLGDMWVRGGEGGYRMAPV